MAKVLLGDLLGSNDIEDFQSFDLTEVQKVLKSLAVDEVFNISDCQYLQHKCLFAAEILIDFSAKMIKTVGFLESKINTLKNKYALEYKPADEKVRLTAEMRKQAGESHPQVEELSLLLAKSKGAKQALEKKLDLLLKMHYHYKDMCASQQQGIISGTPKAAMTSEQDFKKVGW